MTKDLPGTGSQATQHLCKSHQVSGTASPTAAKTASAYVPCESEQQDAHQAQPMPEESKASLPTKNSNASPDTSTAWQQRVQQLVTNGRAGAQRPPEDNDFNMESFRQIAQVWDYNAEYQDQAPGAIDTVEALMFNMSTGSWRSEGEREGFIEAEVQMWLMEALGKYGYATFDYSADGFTARHESDAILQPLLEWFPLSYINIGGVFDWDNIILE